MNLSQCFTVNDPQKNAFIYQEQQYSYAKFYQIVDRRTGGLKKLNLKKNDRVINLYDNSVNSICNFMAILANENCAVNISPQATDESLSYMLNDTQARCVFLDQSVYESRQQILEDAPFLHYIVITHKDSEEYVVKEHFQEVEAWNPDVDLATIIYTSGSTGLPKGVSLTHQNMRAALLSLDTYLGYKESDVILNALPITFDYGLYQALMSLYAQATLVIETNTRLLNLILVKIKKYQCTVLPGITSLFIMLEKYAQMGNFDLSSVRLVTNTGMVFQKKHIDLIKSLFPKAEIFSMYGLTECKRCSFIPPNILEEKHQSIGLSIPNSTMFIVDDAGNFLKPHEKGEIVVSSPMIMHGYWRKEEETRKKLRYNEKLNCILLHTHDQGYYDEDGYFYFSGRNDDIVKINGKKVNLIEVQKQFEMFPDITSCSLVVTDNGTALFLAYTSDTKINKKELSKYSHENLASHQRPSDFGQFNSMPLNKNGKIDKKELLTLIHTYVAEHATS